MRQHRNNTTEHKRVVLVITPDDESQPATHYDIWNPTPVYLGRRIQDARSANVTVGIRNVDNIDFVEEVMNNVERGYDYWQRS